MRSLAVAAHCMVLARGDDDKYLMSERGGCATVDRGARGPALCMVLHKHGGEEEDEEEEEEEERTSLPSELIVGRPAASHPSCGDSDELKCA